MAISIRIALATLSVGLLSGCVTQVSNAPKMLVPSPSALSVEILPNEAIVLNMPNGEVSIVAAAVDYAEMHVEVRCPSGSSKCRKRVEKMAWKTNRGARHIELGLEGGATLNSEITVNVRIPQRNPLEVKMKYGSLTIENARQPVKVEMKAGDVDITMPEEAVKSAFLRARFGDASLTVPENSIAGKRSTLVGATVDWPHGRGRFPVSAKLRYGDVRLRLLD